MIQYFVDEEKKYYDDLLTHLRKHNKSHTGEKKNDLNYVYVTKDNVLKGAMKTTLGWDWVTISNLHYENLEVLETLISKTAEIYEDVSGIHIYTKDKKIHDDFITIGFSTKESIFCSPKRQRTYIAELIDFPKFQLYDYYAISSKGVVNEYDIIMKEKQEQYLKKYNLKETNEYVLFSAIEDGQFVGGINCEMFEDSMYIDLLAVNQDFRGRQVGTTLMELAEQEARKRNFVSIDVGTAEFQARPFYEKLGYKVILTTKNQPKGFECYTLLKQLRSEDL